MKEDVSRDMRDLVAELTARMNDPDSGIMFEAVDIVVERFHPKRVIIHGPTAKGFVRGRKVRMVVIVESGDTESLWGDIVWDLAMEGIDGDVAVYTEARFEESRHDSSTVAYEASRTGFVAYPPDGVVRRRLRGIRADTYGWDRDRRLNMLIPVPGGARLFVELLRFAISCS